jgi:hypothetical protein
MAAADLRRPPARAGAPPGTARRRHGHLPRELGSYDDPLGHEHRLLAIPARAGSILLVDRDLHEPGEERLIAHLCSDEPPENARLTCARYLEADEGARRCRRVVPADHGREPLFAAAKHHDCGDAHEVRDPLQRVRLELLATRMSIPELRWTRTPAGGAREVLSLREAIASLERYEPLCEMTRRSLARHREDQCVSVTVLRAELGRVLESPIVLNRALREAVLERVRRDQTSMSEIAVRCGRCKRDARGNVSGETSWLARRIGILPEGGQREPTRWIHSDVLALIARQGLGISPREVEL